MRPLAAAFLQVGVWVALMLLLSGYAQWRSEGWPDPDRARPGAMAAFWVLVGAGLLVSVPVVFRVVPEEALARAAGGVNLYLVVGVLGTLAALLLSPPAGPPSLTGRWTPPGSRARRWARCCAPTPGRPPS